MKPTSLKKCTHVLCSGNATEKYCSEACKDSDSRETEIACGCGHPGCDATVTADIHALVSRPSVL
jgi:hypothetical protein